MYIERPLQLFRAQQRTRLTQILSFGLSYKSFQLREFHSSPRCNTDGVYTALTEMRVKIPWIEALRKQKEVDENSGKKSSSTTSLFGQDLKPKRMADSYHRVVSCLLLQNFCHTD